MSIGERHDPETHLIPIALQVAAGTRDKLQIFGDDYPTDDGTCVRDYIHVEDLARAHLLALDKATPGEHKIYNLGSGSGFSNRKVAEVVREVTGHPLPVEIAPAAPATRPHWWPPPTWPARSWAGLRSRPRCTTWSPTRGPSTRSTYREAVRGGVRVRARRRLGGARAGQPDR
ncbi:hypothetical protein Phou_046810 [Phytohabitans houttuyneae]|uniref:UDP-glucose 4-epimerase n=1 Tax=Phytohabitans houttuyneae TaxID=1076126 RepID=A0A6V8KDJ9_9ACTN|nr:hypothetical protein Phou_046810 [Phytohabitans houttuyneae]